MKYFFLLLVITFGCADFDDNSSNNNFEEKSVRGSSCSPGCIWSTYAVSSGIQPLTHYCDGDGCHCVAQGNIYTSCNSSTNQSSIQQNNSDPLPQISTEQSYNINKGKRIADEAYWEARNRNTVGWCYNAVADAVERVTGRFLWGSHAYQSADQFAASNHFFEVWNRNLTTLPQGAIVVWGKGSSQSGHISVSLGNGQEASDHITSQMTYHYGGAPARIFLPK